MEWLRSCYSSKWKLFSNSSLLTRGYYYFTDPRSGFYTQPHNLWSSIWTTDDELSPQTLGEVPSPTVFGGRPWRNGSFAIDKPGAFLIGTRACMEFGERLPLPIINRTLIFGVDSRCWDYKFGTLAIEEWVQECGLVDAQAVACDAVGEAATVEPETVGMELIGEAATVEPETVDMELIGEAATVEPETVGMELIGEAATVEPETVGVQWFQQAEAVEQIEIIGGFSCAGAAPIERYQGYQSGTIALEEAWFVLPVPTADTYVAKFLGNTYLVGCEWFYGPDCSSLTSLGLESIPANWISGVPGVTNLYFKITGNGIKSAFYFVVE